MGEKRVILVSALALLLSAAGLWGGLSRRGEANGRSVTLTPAPNRLRDGTELVAVFVVSSGCVFSRDPTLPAALAGTRRELQARAEKSGKRFVSIGVALDADPTEGTRFLERFGTFDELIVGGGWLNVGFLSFIARDLPGPLATPQLVVVERDIVVDQRVFDVSRDRLLGRYIGVDQIRDARYDVNIVEVQPPGPESGSSVVAGE